MGDPAAIRVGMFRAVAASSRQAVASRCQTAGSMTGKDGAGPVSVGPGPPTTGPGPPTVGGPGSASTGGFSVGTCWLTELDAGAEERDFSVNNDRPITASAIMAAAPSHRRGPRFAAARGGGGAYDARGGGAMGRAAATAGGRGGGAGGRGGGATAVALVSSRGDSPRSPAGGVGALGKARIVALGSKSPREPGNSGGAVGFERTSAGPCGVAGEPVPPGRSWKWSRRNSSGGRLRPGSSGSGSSQ